MNDLENKVNREIVIDIHHRIIDLMKEYRYQPKESITGISLALNTAVLTGELSEGDYVRWLTILLANYQKSLEMKYGAIVDEKILLDSLTEIMESIKPRYYLT